MPNLLFGVLSKLGPPPPKITKVSVASNGGHALRNDSTKWTWGINQINTTTSRLGTGDYVSYYTPTNIAGTQTFVEISKGVIASYAVNISGDGYAWGSNSSGNLGDRTTANRLTPVAICCNIQWRTIQGNIDGSQYFAIGLSTSGTAYGWGSGGANGSPGVGFTSAICVPTLVFGGHNFCKISVGGVHTLAINSVGEVYAWGNGAAGKLGNNSVADRCSPVKVCSNLSFIDISAGIDHSLALTPEGDIYAWGRNNEGQYGDGTTTTRCTPVAACGGYSFTKIYTGDDCSFALTSTGDLYSWGSNLFGQLGLTPSQSPITPTLVTAISNVCDLSVDPRGGIIAINSSGDLYSWGSYMAGCQDVAVCQSTPVAFPSGYNFCSIYAKQISTFNTYLLDSDGYAWTVGQNNSFQRGINSNTVLRACLATPTQVCGNIIFQKLSGSATGCGLSSGQAYCWGLGSSGQIGNFSVVSRLTPTLVCQSSLVFCDIQVGNTHVIAVTDTGVAYTWGAGAGGALGDRSVNNESIPVAVCSGLTFCSISAGNAYSAGVTDTGGGYAWGNNTQGKLGDGTTVSKCEPVLISGGLTWRRIECGDGHTIGLTTSGSAYCWGLGTSGQIGNNSSLNRCVPTAVFGNHTFCEISAGGTTSCAINNLGQAYCWGINTAGMLGDNTIVAKLTPVAVCGGHTFCKISVGRNYVTAITNTGQVYSWGENTDVGYPFGNSFDITVPTLVPYI
jgi:alpha-tubulin suppressor-like RCC1 family protein